ncbi:hypothetical protein [Clostridium sp. LIBA-8841]|uniref:hypothetical protein n=1 Tax=Clostridium sp. LIBA-8841 TaxID=2987530 RepID=UPI002AC66B44|nr:hypothetical protein [Clostridium sp. LIBA-8841]MDZ5253631.1 hypothetical protein [Clostridium sp. LIBA-8841]
MKKSDVVLESLDLVDITSFYVKNNLFLYHYYRAKSYKELGLLDQAEESFKLLNDLVKRKGLTK